VECGAMEAGRRSGDDGIFESSSLATSTVRRFTTNLVFHTLKDCPPHL